MRVQKLLANAGVASRRGADQLISEGRVTVDGHVVTLGERADPSTADVRVDGQRVPVAAGQLYLMLNKPQGVLTTVSDPDGRQTVLDLVAIEQRVFPVGRLDKDTEGLVLLTNDGELTNGLLHPSRGVPRVYVAMLRGRLPRGALTQLREGVELEDGLAKPIAVDLVDKTSQKVLIEITMSEGRNREVRRMLAAVGLSLERLARTKFGGVSLGDLPVGKWRHLTVGEVGTLHAAVESGAVGTN